MKQEAKLRYAAEPLQIKYPAGYAGEKSGRNDDVEFFISTTPKLLSAGEIELVRGLLPKLPYRQALDLTGCVMGLHPDLKNFVSTAELDRYERVNQLPTSKKTPGGKTRPLRERLLLVTEQLVGNA